MSSRIARWYWGTTFIAGFLIWGWRVGEWAKQNGHVDWVDDSTRPLFLLVAFVTFWPAAVAVWCLLYPGDSRALPWDGDDG
jgi:hypothetical protein